MSAALQVSGDLENAGPVAHTPGPWVWADNALRPAESDPDNSSVHTILMREGGSGYLCSNWRKTLRELDADYALIAAAPDLLAALQTLAQRVQLDAGDLREHWAPKSPHGLNAFDVGWEPAIDRALAAIAKATSA